MEWQTNGLPLLGDTSAGRLNHRQAGIIQQGVGDFVEVKLAGLVGVSHIVFPGKAVKLGIADLEIFERSTGNAVVVNDDFGLGE